MTTYSYQPSSSTQFANWGNPATWAGGVVPNSPDADVDFPIVTQTSTGTVYTSTVEVNSGDSFSAHSVQLRDYLLVYGNLSVSGQLTQYSDGEIDMMSGTLTAGSIVNNAYDIQGNGTVNVTSLTNNQLIIGSGLTVNATSLNNVGTLASGGGLTVNVTPGGFTNLSGGTLTGGTYRALPSGSSANPQASNLAINGGSVITVDAASISLEGGTITSRDPASGQDVPLTTSLTSIAASGMLTILNSSYTFGPLNVAGDLALGGTGSHFASSQLVVSSGGMITGVGYLDSPVANDGVIEPMGYGSTLVLNGAVTGHGILEISAGSTTIGQRGAIYTDSHTIEINAPVSENVMFDNNIGTLQLDRPATFTGAIAPSGAGDRIILEGVSTSAVTGTSYVGDTSGGTLTLQEANGSVAIKFVGHFAASSFTLSAGPQNLSSDPPSVVITVNGNAATPAQDFNGDLHSDILWQNVNGAISTWHAAGSGASDGIVRDTYDAQVATSWTAIDSFDFNGDGRSDILWRNQNGAVAVWDGTAGGFAQSSYVSSSIPAGTSIAGAGDFDGDGKGDLLLRASDGSLSSLISTGVGFTGGGYAHASPGAAWTVEGVADFTGDGKADILWRNSDGSLSTWNSTGPGFQDNSWFHQPIDRSWHVAGLGDFNGDGKADILWRNDNGAISVWTSTGTGFTENQFNASAATNWSVAEVGDFNGDGKADILWRNTAGQISIWHSTGAGWQQNTYFDGSVGTDWTIAAHHFPL